ncbi:TetR/AcrR family transcriptional regulator C-terminal ligand-binding domain-containing protein [Streptomyces sp. NPDC049597]|uniref:TetR/AcrR family transcriptional regulator n=1 Tax=Streptomyces sp. NPDC049597 TaxID=3155276 RepID=UPI00342A369D
MAARGGATVPPGQQHGPHGRDARGPGAGAHAHGRDARGSGSGAHAQGPDAQGAGSGAHGPDAGKTGTQSHARPAGAPARRGRPRSEAVERSVIDAVVRLLEEGVAISDLSIERIARTAGVGKATIYRRWEGKESLLVDVVRSMEPVDPPLPGTSVRDDLVALVEMLRRRGLAKRSSALLHNVFAQMQSYPRLWEMYHRIAVTPRRERMDAVLRRGVETGEIRADVDFDLLGDMFVGPMLVRTVLRPESTPGPGSAERIVDTVLRGVRPPG